jgi:hypothetical protein
MHKVVKRQRTILGIVMREVQRKLQALDFVPAQPKALSDLSMWLERAQRIRTQQRQDKNKLYALHAPEVECIGKGKARKPYEFGVKSAVVVSHQHGLMLGARTFPGNPYDGHILSAVLEQDLSYIEIGKAEGATLAFGGRRIPCHTGSGAEGYFMAPALFSESSASMRINREEIFGPVASIIQVKDYEAALATANDTPFGLSAGIATTSLKYATHFKRHSQAGMVMVNLPTAGVDYHVPFGGRKGSSYGPREQGKYAQEFFTTVKTAYTLA